MLFAVIPLIFMGCLPFWKTPYRWRAVTVSIIGGIAVAWVGVTAIAGVTDVLWDQIASYASLPVAGICALTLVRWSLRI